MKSLHGVTRRSFVSWAAGLMASGLARPERLAGAAAGTVPAPLRRVAAATDAEFWAELRKEFLIPPDEAFFNTGTLGSSPRAVLDAVIEHMTHVDRDIAHWDYKDGHENYFTGYYPEEWVRAKLARLINADVDEVALTQNATFGMNFIANGLSLGVGDEVILMEGSHAGGRCGWELRDKRYGAHVRRVSVPVPPESPEQLMGIYEGATTPQTRVWAVPHLTSGTAVLFPVAEMCARARERGILTVIDGAQTLGQLAIDVRAMGCDVFFSSPHKWLLAPKGTGILFVRRDVQPRVWSTLASGEWDNHAAGAYRLMQYGTGNLSLLVGLAKAADFHLELQPARVQQRVLALADRLRDGLEDIAGVTITSPLHPALRSATTIWQVRGRSGEQVQDALWEGGRVRVRSMGAGVRQCCHIYNLEDEVDRSLELTRRIARG
jgi:isopenicillin-N epimerase